MNLFLFITNLNNISYWSQSLHNDSIVPLVFSSVCTYMYHDTLTRWKLTNAGTTSVVCSLGSSLLLFRVFSGRHLAAVCKNKSTKFVVSELREEGDCEMHTLGLFTVSEKSKDDALTVTVEINDRPVIMEVDTGASMSVIPADLYHEKLQHIKLDKPTYRFKSYSGKLRKLHWRKTRGRRSQ